MTDTAETRARPHGSRLLLAAELALLVGVTVLLLHRRPGEGAFWYPDASRHAMDGIFVIDFIRDGGIANPYDYGLHYAAKYPAVGVIYYPPLFAMVEAVVYCVAGISLASARATVVLFAVVGVVAAYLHGRAVRGRGFGLTVALCFVTMPQVVLWSRGVMLEMPVAAMVLLTGLFLHLWADEGKRWAAYACAAALLASVLTKQSAAFMFGVIPLYLVLTRRARLLWSREALISYAVCAVLLLPYALFQWQFYGSEVKRKALGDTSSRELFQARRWLSLFRVLPSASSWPVAVLAGVGLLFAIANRQSPIGNRQSHVGRYLAVWFVVAYVFTAYAMSGSVRYLFLVFPIVAFLAAYGAYAVLPVRLRRIPVRGLALGALLGYQGWLAWHVDAPRVSDGYQQAAELVASAPRGETVLFDGYLSGNFIYHVRAADTARRLIVLRSDKLFGRLHRIGEKKGTFSSDVKTAADVLRLLREHGVGYVVLEPHNSSQARGIKRLLLEAVAQPPWVLRKRVPLTSHRTPPGDGDILIYENPKAGRATAEAMPFWVPFSRRDFHVTYEGVRRIGATGTE